MHATVRVTLRILNAYPHDTITTHEQATVPAPPPAPDERTAWADEHLFPLTGTGRSTEPAHGYLVTITDSTDPSLIGTELELHYGS